MTGRNSIAAYWAPKLENKRVPAFNLDDVVLTGHGVQIDYQSYEGKPVRFYFRFGSSNMIIYTRRPIDRSRGYNLTQLKKLARTGL